MRILIVRNDKLGDFMLAWPSFALIKHYWPQVTLTTIVPEYTAPMARICPWIDEVLIENRELGVWALSKQLRAGKFDAMLTLFSTGRMAVAGILAAIPYRLAPATKLAQFCYNKRLTQRRSQSQKPEYAYNLELAARLLADFGIEAKSSPVAPPQDYLPAEVGRPLMPINDDVIQLHREFIAHYKLAPDTKLVFIHPGSGGSANTLTPLQYAQLALLLQSTSPLAFIITAGPGEETVASKVVSAIEEGGGTARQYSSKLGLLDFSRTLQLADLFISASTGPLHIAAALNRPTAAFYPRRRSATPLRWQTLNAPDIRLSFVPPASAPEEAVDKIDLIEAASTISRQLLSP